jgi:hypothetical protein
MASYVPVPITDPNYGPLTAMSLRVGKYVVTWANAVDAVRKIYGVYKTQRQAFIACREASNRSTVAFPLCFLASAGSFFKVVGDNIFTH